MKTSKFQLTLGLALACAAITFSLAVCAQAQTLSYLADFDGTNGLQPFGGVTQATDRNFYGTTTNGGGHGYGNVYRITPGGEITSIYDFCKRPNCADGTTPESAPVLGSDGNLYGTTTGIDYGNGTVYKMTLSGELTTLYTFCSLAECADGSVPNGLMQASDGNFYGTTFSGGNSNAGTIFKITPAGQFTSLYSFCSLANCADGNTPVSPPIEGSDGGLYGAAWQYLGGGVLYRLTLAGDYKVLYSFCRGIFCSGGSGPLAMVQDANGNFFGTTQYGGGSDDVGTLFELTSKQQFINLHNFDKTDGAYPSAGLTLANDGNLYGATVEGGPADAGTIFEITAAGTFRTLYTFAHPYACYPTGPLFQQWLRPPGHGLRILEWPRPVGTNRTGGGRSRKKRSHPRQRSDWIYQRHFQRRGGGVYGRIRYLYQSDGSKGRDYGSGVCCYSEWNAEQQSAVCCRGVEIQAARLPPCAA
jgi:uncharacterized repeat protein (TIGR03803 family)